MQTKSNAVVTDDVAPPVRQRLGATISLAARHWRRVVDLRLQGYGLTQAMWLPLLKLAQASTPMRQKELAAALFLDTSSIVRILDGLQAAKLIECREDAFDRRAKAIVITRQGRALARKVESVSEDVQREVLEGLPAAEVDIARGVLATICERLVQLGADPDPAAAAVARPRSGAERA
jgi:MarR family transcriptional regulator for hemolysin